MLQKGFLTKKNKIIVSKKRFWISVIIGLISSFGIYTFFCMFRLVLRTLDFESSNWALIIEDSERYLQNVAFASIALVLGNSVFITRIFGKPLKSKLPSFRRLDIINNQYFLGFTFFYVFSKAFFMLMIFSVFFTDFFSNMKNIKLLVVFCALVLFLESWKTIIRVFRSTVYKPLLINLLVIIVLTFLFSSTSVFDYKTVDTQLAKTNPYVNLPISKYASKKRWYYNVKIKIFKKDNAIKYNFYGKNFSNIDDLINTILDNHTYGMPIQRKIFFILAGSEIRMLEIKKVEKALYKSSISRIKYIIQYPNDRKNARFSLKGIYKYLYFSDIEIINKDSSQKAFPLPPPLKIDYKEKILVRINDNYQFNNVSVKNDGLVEFFVKRINDSTVFHYEYDDSLSFQKYITLFSAHNQAVEDLRVNDQRVELIMDSKFRYTNEEEFEKDQSRLRKKYPLNYFENADYVE